MKKVTVEEAFKLEGLDVNNIKIKGVPERHIPGLLAAAKLWVTADHVDGDGALDYSNDDQYKYENWVNMDESPSGGGFSLRSVVDWNSNTVVGARLNFKTREAAREHFEDNKELYRDLMVYERKLQTKKNNSDEQI